MVRSHRLLPLLIALALLGGCVPSAAGARATSSIAAQKKAAAQKRAKARHHRAKRHRIKRRTVKKLTGSATAQTGSDSAVSTVAPPTSTAATTEPVITDCGVTIQRPEVDADATAVAAVLCLVNNERSRAGLSPLVQNVALDNAAQAHSADMVAKQYFQHTDPFGVGVMGRVLAAGWVTLDQRWRVGENIGWGSGSYASPRSVVLRWMNSAPHRANMLEPAFREIGVGVAAGSPMPQPVPGATYTIDVGVRG
jgi:uncharacterized protein YkwD